MVDHDLLREGDESDEDEDGDTTMGDVTLLQE